MFLYFSYFVKKYIQLKEELRASTVVVIHYDVLEIPEGTNKLITDSLQFQYELSKMFYQKEADLERYLKATKLLK